MLGFGALGQLALGEVRRNVFFGEPGRAPVFDWPNPTWPKSAGAAGSSQGAVTENRSVTLLGGKDLFFGSPGMGPDYDWANPVWPKSRAAVSSQDAVTENRSINLLAGRDQFFGSPGEVRGYDWPNPAYRQPREAIYAQSNVWANLLGTLLAVAVTAAPMVQDNPRGSVNRVALQFDPPNLLGTTLAPAAPFTLADQPNPLRRPWTQPPDFGGSRLLSTLAGQDSYFGRPGEVQDYDWPNPTRAPYRQAAVQSQPNGQSLVIATLGGQDAFFGVGGPAYDWPNPTLARSRYVASVAQPNGQPANVGLLSGQDQFFGAPGEAPRYDWAIARGAGRPGAQDPANLLTTLLAIAPAAPFAPADWPNPRRSQRAPPSDPSGSLVLSPAAPFAQADWPNPRSRPTVQQPYQAGVLQATLSLVPFAQYDWPGVRGPAQAQKQQGLGSPLQGALGISAPFSLSDWPNPTTLKSYWRGQLDPANQLPLHLEIFPPPFNITDWPNPYLATVRRASWQFSLEPLLPTSALARGRPPSGIAIARAADGDAIARATDGDAIARAADGDAIPRQPGQPARGR